jgi:hypothetical protein
MAGGWRCVDARPGAEQRAEIADRVAKIRGRPEELLEPLLDEIATRLEAAVDTVTDVDDAEDLLAACQSWASVASYAVGGFYAPDLMRLLGSSSDL